MGPARIGRTSHEFATQSSHSVDLAGCQAKMASIEIWIPWRNAHKPRSHAGHQPSLVRYIQANRIRFMSGVFYICNDHELSCYFRRYQCQVPTATDFTLTWRVRQTELKTSTGGSNSINKKENVLKLIEFYCIFGEETLKGGRKRRLKKSGESGASARTYSSSAKLARPPR